MNKLSMYRIIISILTCQILGIPMPSIEFYEKQDGRRDCTIQMETAVAIETIDQLSIYTYVYVDNSRIIYMMKR